MRFRYVHKITCANEHVTENAHWPVEERRGEEIGAGRSCDGRQINLMQ